MAVSITITQLVPRRMGEEVELTVKLSDGGGHEETRKLVLSSKMLFEIGNIGGERLPYELTPEQFDTLEYDAKLWEAIKKGLDLLSYGDNTKSALTTKLRSRGFDKYISADAAEYLAALGYIDERRILERVVEQLANIKLYGKSRIKSELYKKGISREVLTEHLGRCFDEIDFEENLMKLVKRKCDFEALSDRKYRESFYAAMYRLGYTVSEVRAALREMEE